MNRAGMHPADDELVLAADGELTARRRAIVDAHLGDCSACRDRFAEIESTLAAPRHSLKNACVILTCARPSAIEPQPGTFEYLPGSCSL